MGDLEKILLSLFPCAPIIYDLIIKMKTWRAASRLTLGAMRHKEFNWKVHVDLWKLRAKFTRLATQIGQGVGSEGSARWEVGGAKEGKGFTPFAPSLGNSFPLFVAFCFSFSFIFFHNFHFFWVFSVCSIEVFKWNPLPGCQSPCPTAPLASLLIVIINKSIQNIFHAQFVGHVNRHKPSSTSIYFRAGFSFRAIYKLYLHKHTHAHTNTLTQIYFVNCIVSLAFSFSFASRFDIVFGPILTSFTLKQLSAYVGYKAQGNANSRQRGGGGG